MHVPRLRRVERAGAVHGRLIVPDHQIELSPRVRVDEFPLRRVLDQIAESDPKAKTAKPEQFVDTRLLSELDRSGFIDSLYK